MKTIRSNVFETNSSSCHTITFINPNNNHLRYWPSGSYKTLRMSSEEDFYGGGEFNDPITKAMYFSDALSAYILREFRNKAAEYYFNKGITEEDFKPDFPDTIRERLLKKVDYNGYSLNDEQYKNFIMSYAEDLKEQKEVLDPILELLSQIKDSIGAYFENEGIKIIWEDTYGDDWTETLKPKGQIDHQSNIYEDEDCEKLALLFQDVPTLYKWIMTKEGALYLTSDG